MKDASKGIWLEVDRGPNWLFVMVHPGKSKKGLKSLGEELWEVVARHFVYRLVVEMQDFHTLPDHVIDQLADLRERLEAHGGALRVCGLRPSCAKKLACSGVGETLKCHPSRASAVWDADLAHHHPTGPHGGWDATTEQKDLAAATTNTADEPALTR